MRTLLLVALLIIANTTFGQRLQDFKKEESWYDFKNLKSQKTRLTEFASNFKQLTSYPKYFLPITAILTSFTRETKQ